MCNVNKNYFMLKPTEKTLQIYKEIKDGNSIVMTAKKNGISYYRAYFIFHNLEKKFYNVPLPKTIQNSIKKIKKKKKEKRQKKA